MSSFNFCSSLAGQRRILLIFMTLAFWSFLELADFTHEKRVSKPSTAALAIAQQTVESGLNDGWTCPFKRKTISCAAREIAKAQYEQKKIVLCLHDSNSGMHPKQLSQFNEPTQFAWRRDCPAEAPPLGTLFSLNSLTHEDYIFQGNCCGNNSYKLFVATEPPAIQPYMYEFMKVASYEYDAILSLGGKDLVTGGNFIHWSWGSSWVPLEQWKMYPKTKLCSIIASNQNFAPGHQLRHKAVELLRKKGFDCDILGHGYKPFPYKRDALADYMFGIIIENSVSGNYMTEKIMDSIGCGTIPVYWGTDYAETMFADGILPWRDIDQLEKILGTLNRELYDKMLPMATRNQDEARKFVPPERWLWENVFKCAYEWHATHDECSP